METLRFLALMDAINQVILGAQHDTWIWFIDASSGFYAASVRSLIDSKNLEVANITTRWNRFLLSKVNVFFWQLNLNKIPTIVNLDKRGIDIGSARCPICDLDVKAFNHIFFSCGMTLKLWNFFTTWWELDIPVFSSILDWLACIDHMRLRVNDNDNDKRCFDVACLTIFRLIWSF